MRRRFGLLSVAWALLGLLAIAAGLFVLGTRERISNPSAFSYAPSGTAAFVELLRKAGYSVQISRRSKPDLGPNQVAVGFLIEETDIWHAEPAAQELAGHRTLREFLSGGGRALFIQVPYDFSSATRLAARGPMPVKLAAAISGPNEGRTLSVTRGSEYSPSPNETFLDVAAIPFSAAVSSQDEPVLQVQVLEKGFAATVLHGTGATNRFLDQEQNADFLLWAMAMINPDRNPVVVLEGLVGEPADPGLLGTLGGWAVAGWWQFVLVLVVIAYTLGRRFGLPEVTRNRQRSSRELVDAYADVMRRARRPDVALQKIVSEVDRDLRRKFNIAPDLPPNRRNEFLPPKLGEALTQAEIASRTVRNDFDARWALIAVQDELAAMKGETPKRRRRRRT